MQVTLLEKIQQHGDWMSSYKYNYCYYEDISKFFKLKFEDAWRGTVNCMCQFDLSGLHNAPEDIGSLLDKEVNIFAWSKTLLQ